MRVCLIALILFIATSAAAQGPTVTPYPTPTPWPTPAATPFGFDVNMRDLADSGIAFWQGWMGTIWQTIAAVLVAVLVLLGILSIRRRLERL